MKVHIEQLDCPIGCGSLGILTISTSVSQYSISADAGAVFILAMVFSLALEHLNNGLNQVCNRC
jgi:hypothetical protein